eukprot:PITA_04916
MKYIVSSQERPDNYPLYSVHIDLDSFTLYNENDEDIDTQVKQAENEFNEKHDTQVPIMQQNPETEPLWNMTFDGSCGKIGSGKNNYGHEQTIAFFSKATRDASLKYNIMEKQAFALVKAIKDFRVYVVHSHIIAYVPNVVVKDIITQNGPDGKRGKWIDVILEYDIEIKPTKLIKGQGLAKLMAESNFNALDINMVFALDDLEGLETPPIDEAYLNSPWYADLLYVLFNLNSPHELSKTKARVLKLKTFKFCIVDGILYQKDARGVLLRCLLKDDADKVMQEFHEGDCGSHLYWKTNSNKILRAGYYWPTLIPDIHNMVTACHKCQLFIGERKLLPLPLKPISVESPFQQWGLDFIGEIHPPSSTQYRWILTAIDYFTKWIEAIPSSATTDSVIIEFLETNILLDLVVLGN